MRGHRPSTLRLAGSALLLALAALLTACTSSVGDGTVPPGAGEATTTTSGDPALGDLTRVTGTVEVGELTGALERPVALPLALTVAERGRGNGGIVNGVTVAGVASSIVWDGGRPATISGEGTIAVQPGPFRLADGALVAWMGDAAHELSPGDYVFDGPAAVGDTGGLAQPSDRTAFRAEPGATFSGTGQVEGRLPAGTWALLGPGRVVLTGSLVVETASSTAPATAVSMEQGSFEATITTSDGTAQVEVLLDGAVTVR